MATVIRDAATCVHQTQDRPAGGDPAVERVRQHLARYGLADRIILLPKDTSTAPKAAAALGVTVGEIAKTLCFVGNGGAVIVVAAGDAHVSQSKLKSAMGWTGKLRLATPEETQQLTSFQIGGVCPFGLPQPLPVLLDTSLLSYRVIYPAAGSSNSAVRLTPEELARATGGRWCDLTS
ncbi:MAG: YbaK/EbsC family protein [Bacillota bacterium]